MTRYSLLLATTFAVLFPSLVRAAPQIGDKAPPVKVAKWMTLAPPALPNDKGAEKHIFLVEFWATWCGPCMKSVPHLAELHRKHQKDGLVVLGISNEEPDTIASFLSGKAKKLKLEMPYFVGSDEDMDTQNVWMKDVEGIPYAFVVDKTGTIVWTGNPLADTKVMDDTIKQVLTGSFDIVAAKKAAANAKKANELMGELRAAYGNQDKERVFKILDEIMALKPNDIQAYLIKKQLLAEFDMEDQIPAWEAKIEVAMKDSSDGLLQLAAVELEKPLSDRNAAMLYRSVNRANELTNGQDAEALLLLAQTQCTMGMIDAAIATQKKAIDLTTGEQAEEFKRVLKYYETSKELAQSVTQTQ
ncbi:MAG TPA: TlpA disulfide reductase family protein [Phycisphaerae bacterium]|nr:TlpA disulfide reductase family protein [Phycisphaerae bacterium]